mmetsp:Transcript_151110/g.483560  ORF Transcript_151110/g.483560 Transcript_151110/m.483560 type:complete len:96 (+) Transcript_151110:192-479(+)
MQFEKRPNYDGMRGLFNYLRDKHEPPLEDHHLMWIIKEDSKYNVDPSKMEPLDKVERCAAQHEETCGASMDMGSDGTDGLLVGGPALAERASSLR